MQCPNCKAEMKEGSLYCYECGEDIHMVPDYDPDLDITINHTPRSTNRTTIKKKKKKKNTFETVMSILQICGMLVMIGIVIKGIFWASALGDSFELLDYKNPGQIIGPGDGIGDFVPVPVIQMPEFSYDEGYYNEIIPLKLACEANQDIYYTLDGSDPTVSGSLYYQTIFIEDGTVEVKAVARAKDGRYSEIASRIYQVEIIQPRCPEVPTIDGQYSRPTYIEVLMEEGERVVYTTDGSLPTPLSAEYLAPIPMPLGNSEFNFAYLEEDETVSEATNRKYQLRIQNGISLMQAKDSLYQALFDAGKRVEGYYADEGYGVYRYIYSQVTTIDNMDFYIYDEELLRNDGAGGMTLRRYAVHTTTGQVYGLESYGEGSYTLVTLQ